MPPRTVPTFANPGQVLDYRRFQSDALLGQYRAEVEVLRRVTPDVPVTTNFMTNDHFRHLDYAAWAEHVDVVSTDHYVIGDLADPEAELAFTADHTRGLAGGDPWLLMEHSTSAVNWQRVNVAKRPGQMMRHSLGHVARGADALGFFQWRASRVGAEKFHSGLVPHAGTDSRLWREVVELGAVAGRLGEVRGSRVDADVALLWDHHADWACDQEAHPSSEVRYGAVAHDLHASLRRQGVTVDVVPVSDAAGVTPDLTGYRVVLVPTLYLTSDATAAAVQAAADAGAHVVVTYFSGIVDEHDHVRLGGYPGAFRDLLGVRVEELAPVLPGVVLTLDDRLVAGASGSVWAEDLRCTDAEAVTSFVDGPVPGVPAVTRREVEAGGVAWYVATRLDEAGTDALTARVVGEAGVAPVVDVPPGVDVTRRRDGERSWLFVVNHTDAEVVVDVTGHDLVAERGVGGTDEPLRVAAGGCAVVREG